MKKKVLIINNNTDEIEEIRQGFDDATEVIVAPSVDVALHYFIRLDFCLIILDAHISSADDHRLIKAMRSAKTMPILVLSSDTSHSERIHVFQAGANAFMHKPYTLEECLAQAHTLMQLHIDAEPKHKLCYTLAFGRDLIIDPTTRQVTLKGKPLNFTKKEFDVLFCLASNAGQVFSREQLYACVWDEFAIHNVDDVVKNHIKSLRQKLAHSELEYIQNVRGVGYCFANQLSVK